MITKLSAAERGRDEIKALKSFCETTLAKIDTAWNLVKERARQEERLLQEALEKKASGNDKGSRPSSNSPSKVQTPNDSPTVKALE